MREVPSDEKNELVKYLRLNWETPENYIIGKFHVKPPPPIRRIRCGMNDFESRTSYASDSIRITVVLPLSIER